jgi:thiol-disulfide isomerase/thioredoxin
MLKFTRLVSSCFIAIILTGGVPCDADDQSGTDDAAVAAGDVKLTAGDWSDVKAMIRKHHGKIVVVDVWSTSCLPCMKEFPHLIELQKHHRENVVCVSLNVDYVGIRSRPAEHYRPRVEAFLKKSKSAIPNVLCTKAADELFQELDLTSIPAVYVFGRDGKQAKRFDSSLLEDGKEEAFTYKDDIKPFVEKLLADQR